MNEIEIRKVIPNDIEKLQEISRNTFYEAFFSCNTEEDMAKYLDENLSLEKLGSEISNPNSEFYFAVYENEIVGYLKLNFGEAQTDIKENNAVEIERIYILKEFYGKKVAQTLYEKAIQIAKLLKAEYIWLGVWEENARAIRFYRKNGFVEFGKHFFMLGNDKQTDILMRCPVS